MSWTGRPCERCGGKKGPNQASKKYCYRCGIAAKKAAKDAKHDHAVSIRYNIGPGDYQRLYTFQGGRCAICQRATGRTRRLSVDHDHKTEKVRGLLCGPCNDLLGHSRDDPQFFARAAAYLIDPPAPKVLRRTPVPLDGPDLGSTALSAGGGVL